jgi:hypothetical protein
VTHSSANKKRQPFWSVPARSRSRLILIPCVTPAASSSKFESCDDTCNSQELLTQCQHNTGFIVFGSTKPVCVSAGTKIPRLAAMHVWFPTQAEMRDAVGWADMIRRAIQARHPVFAWRFRTLLCP